MNKPEWNKPEWNKTESSKKHTNTGGGRRPLKQKTRLSKRTVRLKNKKHNDLSIMSVKYIWPIMSFNSNVPVFYQNDLSLVRYDY